MTDVALDLPESTDEVGAHDAHDHPQEKQYWIIFVILAVVTAAEVAWSYLGLSGPALILPLIIMMILKFVVVAGVFMHLYFDFKVPNGRYFTFLFVFGLVLAICVYAAVLFAAPFHQ